MAHPKGLLMEQLRKLGIGKPDFKTENSGPEHEPTFISDVIVDGEVYGTGQGSTKREAERMAAEEALAYLERNPLELAGKAEEHDDDDDQSDDGRFEGPWPMFDDLLAACLEVANARTDVRLSGNEARAQIRQFTLDLYKDLLEDLGDVVEEDDEEEDEAA